MIFARESRRDGGGGRGEGEEARELAGEMAPWGKWSAVSARAARG